MEKTDFQTDTRYTITWQQPNGRLVPAMIYVHRTHDSYMIVRITGADGILQKISYPDVTRIAATEIVSPENRRTLPAALLDEKTWHGRSVMAHYSSSAALGK